MWFSHVLLQMVIWVTKRAASWQCCIALFLFDPLCGHIVRTSEKGRGKLFEQNEVIGAKQHVIFGAARSYVEEDAQS